MKNITRIGASLLGTWTAETQLSTGHGDSLTAYFVAHFMPDPRRAHSCSLTDCEEVNNHVCVITGDGEGRAKKDCQNIAEEHDVSWSDCKFLLFLLFCIARSIYFIPILSIFHFPPLSLFFFAKPTVTVFFNFGIKIDSKSSPKAQLDLTTGDWIGPWNLIMAQDTDSSIVLEQNIHVDTDIDSSMETVVDKYVSRYVQSQSMAPAFLQNIPPAECTLYSKADDYAAFLGSSTLEHMTHVQKNYSITNHTAPSTKDDPYAPYLESCSHGNVQPMLPQLELEFVTTNRSLPTTTTKAENLDIILKLKYKIMAVPTPDEQTYRVLPQIQSKFQGQGDYNIMSGPYCYGDDPLRGYSFDLNFNTAIHSNSERQKEQPTFVQGCVDGYPCLPPAAIGKNILLPANNSCDDNNNRNHHHNSHDDNHDHLGVLTMLLSLGCYSFAIAFMVSATFNCHLSYKHKQAMTKYKKERDDGMWVHVENKFAGETMKVHDATKAKDGVIEYLGGSGPGQPAADHMDQTEEIDPFGDLVDRDIEEKTEDPLQEPLLRGTN